MLIRMPRLRLQSRAALVLAAAAAIGLLTVRESVASEIAAAEFDRIGSQALATKQAPGFAFAVVHDGKVVYARGFGYADLRRETHVTPETRFAIGSLTKQFTAAASLLLAQQGKLALDDRLAAYLPAFPHGADITLRMLLNQTSGLHNYPLGEHPWPTAGPIALSEIVAVLAANPLDFPPGTQWAYSNTNYTLLAAVIAQASAGDEAAFLKTHIFEPLAMRASGYGYTAQQQPNLAHAYTGTGTFTQQDPSSLDLAAGAGGMVSNALDLGAWDIALMRGSVLDAGSMKSLWSPGKLSDGTPVDYAMGFVPAQLDGHREVWHNGLTPGAGGYCYNAILPDDELAVIVLSDGADFAGVPERMARQVLAAFDPDAATAPTPAPGEDPAVTARAKDWFHRLQTGTVDLSQVTPEFAQRLTPDLLAQIKAGLAGTAAPTGWVYQGSHAAAAAGAVISTYAIEFGGAAHTFSIGLTPDGKIAGSLLK